MKIWLKKGNVAMQKGAFKNIKPWFYPFQGILGLHPPKQKLAVAEYGRVFFTYFFLCKFYSQAVL